MSDKLDDPEVKAAIEVLWSKNITINQLKEAFFYLREQNKEVHK